MCPAHGYAAALPLSMGSPHSVPAPHGLPAHLMRYRQRIGWGVGAGRAAVEASLRRVVSSLRNAVLPADDARAFVEEVLLRARLCGPPEGGALPALPEDPSPQPQIR